MNRRCQVCMMRDEGYRFDYFDAGEDTRRGFYHAKYSTQDGRRFWLWHSNMCPQCKYDGTLIARMTFSAPVPQVLILPKAESKK